MDEDGLNGREGRNGRTAHNPPNLMFSPIYSAAITTVSLAYLPKLIYGMLSGEKYRKSFLQRLGIGWPVLPKGPLIWIHAVSVGETRAIAKLASLISIEHSYPLVISSVTETGHDEALRLIPQATAHLFLPIDLKIVLQPLLSFVEVHTLIISEGDLWWRFMNLCRERGARIALVNGKLSERSLHRLKRCAPLRHRFCSLLELCCVQNALYAERFRLLGVPEERIAITGNLKFDAVPVTSELDSRLRHFLSEPQPQLIAVGSTHSGEEQQLLPILKRLLVRYPNLKVAIAPRHPHRFRDVAALLASEAYEFPIAHLSDAKSNPWRLLLIDAMGVLPQIYPLASLAIVGGSFVPRVGGHNIIEPCLAGTPVLFGPHMHTQLEMVELVEYHGCGQQLQDVASLERAVIDMMEHLSPLRHCCSKLKEAVQGSSGKTYQLLKPLVE